MNFLEELLAIPEYTRQNWDEEMKVPGIGLTFLNGYGFGSEIPCPLCKTVGFYGPRISGSIDRDDSRRYRACKFCGLWQEAQGDARDKYGPKAYRCKAIYCPNCSPDRLDIYNWHTPEVVDFGNCANCQTKLIETQWAVDNPKHPFHTIKFVIAQSLGAKSL